MIWEISTLPSLKNGKDKKQWIYYDYIVKYYTIKPIHYVDCNSKHKNQGNTEKSDKKLGEKDDNE